MVILGFESHRVFTRPIKKPIIRLSEETQGDFEYREFAIATGIAGQIIPMQDAIAKHRTTLASQDSNV